MNDLVAWLRQQLDDDEHAIRRIAAASCHGVESTAEKDYFRFVDRAPAEVDAKRRILDLHVPWQSGYRWVDADTRVPDLRCSVCHDIPADVDYDNPAYAVEFPCPTLRLLALPYADREGFREEWRPA